MRLGTETVANKHYDVVVVGGGINGVGIAQAAAASYAALAENHKKRKTDAQAA